MASSATERGPLSVAWVADTEGVEAMGLTRGLLVLPDVPSDLQATLGVESVHRVYWLAKTPAELAQLCALPIALAMETGVWSLACKIVRDNPEPGEARGTRFPDFIEPRWPCSSASRTLVEGLITAVAAGARSKDGSHVVPMASARSALLEYISNLERLAGRR